MRTAHSFMGQSSVIKSLKNQLYVIFGLNVPLLGMNRTCLVKIIHVWQKSHMFGKNHTRVEFTTQQDICKMVGKKHTCVGKTTVN